MNPNELYGDIELTDEELKAAVMEGKKKKYFHERSKQYWENQEVKKGTKTAVKPVTVL